MNRSMLLIKESCSIESKIVDIICDINFDFENIYDIACLAEKYSKINSKHTCYELLSNLSFIIAKMMDKTCPEIHKEKLKKRYINFVEYCIFNYNGITENLSMDAVIIPFINSFISIIIALNNISKDKLDSYFITLMESFLNIFPSHYTDIIVIILKIMYRKNETIASINQLIPEPGQCIDKIMDIRVNILPVNRRLLYNSQIDINLESIHFQDNLTVGEDLLCMLKNINSRHACESEDEEELLEIYEAVYALGRLSIFDTIFTDTRIPFSAYIKLLVYIEVIFSVIKYHMNLSEEKYLNYYNFLVSKTILSITKIYDLSSDAISIIEYIIDECI